MNVDILYRTQIIQSVIIQEQFVETRSNESDSKDINMYIPYTLYPKKNYQNYYLIFV